MSHLVYTVNRLRSSVPLTSCFRPPSGRESAAGTFLVGGIHMSKSYVCPHFGAGAEMLDGMVTVRDVHGNVRTFPCVEWQDEKCDMCRCRDEPAGESNREPDELHERK